MFNKTHDPSELVFPLFSFFNFFQGTHISEYKIEYEYSSLPKWLDRNFFFTFFLTETSSFFTQWSIKNFHCDLIIYLLFKYLASCRLVTSFIGN